MYVCQKVESTGFAGLRVIKITSVSYLTPVRNTGYIYLVNCTLPTGCILEAVRLVLTEICFLYKPGLVPLELLLKFSGVGTQVNET